MKLTLLIPSTLMGLRQRSREVMYVKAVMKQEELHERKELGHSRFFRVGRKLRILRLMIFKAPKEVLFRDSVNVWLPFNIQNIFLKLRNGNETCMFNYVQPHLNLLHTTNLQTPLHTYRGLVLGSPHTHHNPRMLKFLM